MIVLDAIGRGIAEGWWMFFDTFWALVLGFGLSGAVQAFASRTEMQHALGGGGPKTLARATFFGTISSSCSYAASALAKSLFARGADFTAAMVFMIASTNLVVELGIVMWLLIGWQFALAEFVGGAIMIVLVGLVLPRVIPRSWIEDAREQLNTGPTGDGMDEHHGQQDPRLRHLPWRQRLRNRQGWSEAAGFTVSDLTMVRKEMVAGFLIAGSAAALAPAWFWRSLFIDGHGFWSSLENVALGPFLAIISFVCSVGNVPLAAALWKGGISFGGVISFVFADLITLPLLLIYRKYFGTKLTLRLFASFWVAMSAAGLATQYLFQAISLVPAHRKTQVAGIHFGPNYTTVLNILAAVAFAVLYSVYRSAGRTGSEDSDHFAKDVVCGMQVEKAHAPGRASFGGTMQYFCSDRCRERFTADPDRFAGGLTIEPMDDTAPGESAEHRASVDPVCGMTVRRTAATPRAAYAGRAFVFCSTNCRDVFNEDPLAHLTQAPDPVCKMIVDLNAATSIADHDGRRYAFCSTGCRDAFVSSPVDFLAASEIGNGGRGGVHLGRSRNHQ